MQVAAARAGAPLGHDFCVISLSDQRKPWSVIAGRLTAAASADLAIALYNPASQTRREQLSRARELLLQQRAPETPVILARALGSAEETLTVTTLAAADLGVVDMRTLVLIGSSQTRVVRDASGAERVYTPRTYPG
jgi:precorrin-2 C20-methyltransferase/precorrin-3B C17-methyltransferase